MPIYFFGVNDEHPSLVTYKNLPDDRAACAWATVVKQELNHRRKRSHMVAVKAYRIDGTLVARDD